MGCDAEPDGAGAAVEVFRVRLVPIILIADRHDPDLVKRAVAAPVMAYFVKPVAPTSLLPAVSIALRRFAEFEAVRRKVEEFRKALDERKVIERAKGILMRKSGLGEVDTYHRLQQLTRNSNLNLADVADSILLAEEAYQPAAG
ncbi:ANTAR domain-containing protein [bacterium]|nr:ANTAR domain-containing protein [bacterium]